MIKIQEIYGKTIVVSSEIEGGAPVAIERTKTSAGEEIRAAGVIFNTVESRGDFITGIIYEEEKRRGPVQFYKTETSKNIEQHIKRLSEHYTNPKADTKSRSIQNRQPNIKRDEKLRRAAQAIKRAAHL